MALSTNTGQISGTPSTAGNYTVAASVRDSENSPVSVSKTFSLTITSTPPPALSVTTASLPAGTQGSSYSTGLAASGGITPYSWSATGLPAGLSLNSGTGQIAGTPSTAGNYTVTAS
ncbi:MAG: peptidase S8, partial [Acidobacteria bacterium]